MQRSPINLTLRRPNAFLRTVRQRNEKPSNYLSLIVRIAESSEQIAHFAPFEDAQSLSSPTHMNASPDLPEPHLGTLSPRVTEFLHGKRAQLYPTYRLEVTMGRQMRADLEQRFVAAERADTCVTPISTNDTRRLRLAVKNGHLIEVAHHVYARPSYWATLKQTKRSLHILRALSAAHPPWVFCGPSAALAFDLSVSYQLLSQVHVLTSKKSHTRSGDGICRHVSGICETTVVNGVTVTTIERTVFDCLRLADFRHGLAIADSALHLGLASKEDLLAFIERQDKRISGWKQALRTMSYTDRRAESGGESIARAIIIEQGFALPELQHVVRDPVDSSIEFRVDFWWEIEGQPAIIGELDGHDKYIDPTMTKGRSIVEVMTDERLRESRISGTGAKVLRFSFADVLNTTYFVHLLESFGVPRVIADSEPPTGHMSPTEARYLEAMRNEALLYWEMYKSAEVCSSAERL